MKKVVSLFFTCILAPQFALASITTDLKSVIDDYNYSMTIEWDQQDSSFAQEKEIQLQTEINQLIQAGLTKEEFLGLYPEAQELEEELKFIDMKNPITVAEFMQKHQKYKKGAAWSGELTEGLIAFAAILVLVAFISYKAKDCGGPKCTT